MRRNFDPVHQVTYYQARCTNCGTIVDSYGDYSAWDDPHAPIREVVDCHDWWQSVDGETLLCRACQICAQCQGSPDDDHDDHDFTLPPIITTEGRTP